MNVYDFKAKTMDGKEISLDTYRGKVLVIANTASKCGFTPQYAGLQKLYQQYQARGFEVLGFPCNQFAEQEPAENHEVQQFCEINFGVTFPLFQKVEARGSNAHPLFQYLTAQAPFKGLDLEHPIGNALTDALQNNFPEYLEGDSIKWNFTKFLIERNGNVVGRFEPTTEPEAMQTEIEKYLNQ
ncbi:MAG TPA: glutathione peroxidase [Bacillota bacterium]|nr:glutathione peroxidase [Bacillota bacterium]